MYSQIISLLRRSIRLIKVLVNISIIFSFILSSAAPTRSAIASPSSLSAKNAIASNQIGKTDNNVIFNSTENATSSKGTFSISSLINNAVNPSYYYTTGVLETGFVGSPCSGLLGCNGTVTWSSTPNAIGVQDGVDAKVINSSHYSGGVGYRACMVVSLGQVVNLNNGAIQAFVHQPQDITQDMGMELAVSSSEIPCDSPNWIVAAGYQEVGGLQSGGPGWYGGSYTGDVKAIRIEVWSDGGNGFCLPREFYIDAVRVQGIAVALLDRSSLSNNKPKNGSGDGRECAVSGCSNAQATAGDPIDTRTGNFDYSLVDLSLQTIAGPLSFQRSYASLGIDTNQYPTDLGPGWTNNQDTRLIFETGTIWFKGHTLNQYKFKDNGNQTYTPYAGVLASLTYNSGNSTYSLKSSDQSIYTFSSSGQLQNWRNELGYGFDYSYSNNKLYRITEALSGRYLQFNYQSGHLTSVNDGSNPVRTVSFGYDGNGDLSSFTDARGKTWTYEYDGTSHHLKTLKDPSTPAKTILTIHYDTQGRADEQFNGKNERIVKITYNSDGTSTLLDAMGRTATDVYDGRNTNNARVDSAGYVIQKSYDGNFRPSLVKDQDNRILQYQWSADGANLTYIKDAAGNETHLQYNAQNHLTQVTDPRSQVMTYFYTGSLLTSVTRQTSTGNIPTTYSYTNSSDAPQPVGLLKTITDALNHTTTLTYDAKGQLTAAKDSDNKETHFAYDDQGHVTDVTNPLGRVTHYFYDPAGNATKVIQNYDITKAQNFQNIYNLTTEFTYDNQGRLTQTKNTLNFTAGYAYDDAGRIYLVTDTYGKTTTSIFNAAGQVTTVSDPLGHSTGYDYDSAGRLWKVKDALNRVDLTYAYNLDSTIHTETRPTIGGDYIITYNTYDALKRPINIFDNVNHTSAVTYDAYGNPSTRTDALGRATKYEYNDMGLLSAVTQNYKANPGGGDDPNATNVRTEYTYDVLGNLKKIRDANTHETTFDYDVLNRLWKVTNPLGKATEFGYDALGNRTSLKDAKNNTTTFVYDLANRLQTIDYPVGMTDVGFGYDSLGRLTGMDDGLGHTSWVYDNLNRITSITDPFNKIVGYGYDDDSKRTSITYPSPVSKTISYQYNTLDQLTNVLDGTTHLADYGYDIAGRLNGVTLANGVTSTPGYDLSGQLTSLTHQKGSTQYASYTYHYNVVGNRDQVQEALYYPHFTYLSTILKEGSGGQSQSMGIAPLSPNSLSGSSAYPAPNSDNLLQPNSDGIDPITPENPYPAPESTPSRNDTSLFQKAWDFVVSLFVDRTPTVSAHSDASNAYPAPSSDGGGAPASTQTINYGYDALNRLTGATYTSGSSYSFTYDKVGNRTSQNVGGVNTTYTYDAADRLTNAGGVSFTWDDNGNLLNDGAKSYSYDFANRLTAINGQGSSFSFGYDGLDNRFRQTINGQTTTYMLDKAAGLSQVLYDGTATYYYGLGRISQQKNGVSDYFLTDGLGSVRQLANQSGSVSFGQAFDPFGNSIGRSGQGGSSYGYAGEWTDNSGLQNLRARYYSPTQGRFLTKDPFSGFLNQPSTLNAYAYATNNPVLMSDPSGKIAPLLIAAGLGGLIGAGIDVGVQLYNMQPSSLGQALRCLNWGEVGVSFGAGAIAGLTGFTVFGGMTALMGTGFFANVAAGAISGVVAGQYGRLTGLVLSGQIGQAGSTLFRPQDMLLDAVLGGAIAGIGYGISRIGSPCSFSEDTPVATQDGEKPIGEIKVGEKVLAYDESTQSTGYYPVTDKFAHTDQNLVTLVIDGEIVETTIEHPFYTIEKGWIPAGNLWIGAHILRSDGLSGIIEKISLKHSEQKMFNLTVDQAHTFFVGDGKWLVHNTCPIKLPARNPGDKTRGILDIGSDLIELISGKNGPSSQMPANTPGMRADMSIRTHVEAHAASIMRQQGIEEASLYLNNSPCPGVYGCAAQLPNMLPENSQLHVYVQEGDSWGFYKTFVGLADSLFKFP
jgi:RHS repeat-associated protein